MLEAIKGIFAGLSWGTVPDWVIAGAAALATIQGWRSLSAWRREAGGKRRLELAEEILTRVYEVADAVAFVRNPHGRTEENLDRPGRDEEDSRLREYRDMYYPIVRRLKDSRPAFATLAGQRGRTRALFGDDLLDAYSEVIGIHNEVWEAADELLRDVPWEGEQTEERFARHLSLRGKLWSSEEGDDIETRLVHAVQMVEDRLRPIIKKAMA